MIYRSNVIAPDLTSHFKHAISRPMGHSFGHDVLSDWSDKREDDPVFGIYTRCGFWTHDEAALLYRIAQLRRGLWLDIGAHTGWTTAHLAAAGCEVVCVEPMLRLQMWDERFEDNLRNLWTHIEEATYLRSEQYLRRTTLQFDGVVVDGDHNAPCPLNDATLAHLHLTDPGVILFHDAIGGPVWDGVYYLLDQGYKCKMYFTPHMVACCWRGDWTPPVHVPDPAIPWREIQANHMRGFQWHRVECDAVA